MKFNFLNNIVGWLVCIFACAVYLLTMEPTVSLWDCGEFISCVKELQVPHPPGAPMFVMIGRFFTLFAADDASVALMVNAMSAIASGFGVLFLFWTITRLAKKAIGKAKDERLEMSDTVAVLAAGVVGALACCFADSYWFSAVEGEVYALSSFFTALVFWGIMKWEAVSEDEDADKWIVFIAYMMGISIGVHLLNLLTIPAMVFVYFFKRREEFDALHEKVGMFSRDVFGFGFAAIVGVFALLFLQYGVIPGIPVLMSKFELLFVNSLGLGFNSGIWALIVILVGGVVAAIYYSHKKGMRFWNTISTALAMILIGYSSYFMVVIRSSANPGIDMNNPEEPFNLVSYLLREQYGETPLFSGQYYMAPIKYNSDGTPVKSKVKKKYYPAEDGTYKVKATKWSPEYMDNYVGIFPRMWSGQGRHVKEYRKRVNRYLDGKSEFEIVDIITGKRLVNKSFSKMSDAKSYLGQLKESGQADNRAQVLDKPSFGANISFFMNYQINWMYLRYMGWNFIGRQNDLQGGIENRKNGNVLFGINAIDEARGVIPQADLPEQRANNMGKNKFYGLPFLLIILGALYHFRNRWDDGLIVGLLVFFTGIAIVIFLNQYPFQPRERDYAFAGSVYALCIWVGFGVLAIYDFLKNKVDGKVAAIAAAVVGVFAAPYLMGSEGWDDHDRSGRYAAKDYGVNYLESCAENAILFTQGDNDTYPLWYAQEVEEIRTDVRIVNLSLLAVDWYIDFLRKSITEKDNSVPFSMEPSMYRGEKRDLVTYYAGNKLSKNFDMKKHYPVKSVMNVIKSDKYKTQGDRHVFPTKKMAIPVDFDAIRKYNVIPEDKMQLADSVIRWTYPKTSIYKNDLMTLDLIAHMDWSRPIYFAVSVSPDAYCGLQSYFRLEGLAYRLTPIRGRGGKYEFGSIDVDRMYHNLMNKFKWGEVDRAESMYLDESLMRMCLNLRIQFAKLATELIKLGRNEEAIKALNKCMAGLPEHNVRYGSVMAQFADLYLKAGAIDKGEALAKRLDELYSEKMEYYIRHKGEYSGTFRNDFEDGLRVFNSLTESLKKYSTDKEYTASISTKFNDYIKRGQEYMRR